MPASGAHAGTVPGGQAGIGAGGVLALIACNVAGLMDLVALPLWVGALMGSGGLGPQSAGLTLTCYLAGVLFSSLTLARNFHRITAWKVAAIGYAAASLAFAAMTLAAGAWPLAGLHVLAGIGAGFGLSATHGTIGRSGNPHRLFAIAGFGVGVFAIAFFAGAPALIAAHGANGLFLLLAGMLAASALIAMLVFPRAHASLHVATLQAQPLTSGATPRAAVFAFLAVACLATTEAMVFSTVQGIGLLRGFTMPQIGLVLLLGGFVNLTAPLAAVLLQTRLHAFFVSGAAILLHGCVAALVTSLTSLPEWGVAVVLMVWLLLFGHNFIFGVISRVDPTGRTSASTPAMLMTGSAIGPALGGILAQRFGYASLGPVAIGFALVGTGLFSALWRHSRVCANPAIVLADNTLEAST